MDDLGMLGFSALGVLSFIIGAAKEILIIILVYKLIKMSNIFIKKNDTEKTISEDESLKNDDM